MGISAELKVYPEKGYVVPEGLNVKLYNHLTLHDIFFVTHVQYGDDDQHAYEVEKEQAEELFEIFDLAYEIFEARRDKNHQAKIRMGAPKDARLLAEWMQRDQEQIDSGKFNERLVNDTKQLRDFFETTLKKLEYEKLYVEYRCRH